MDCGRDNLENASSWSRTGELEVIRGHKIISIISCVIIFLSLYVLLCCEKWIEDGSVKIDTHKLLNPRRSEPIRR